MMSVRKLAAAVLAVAGLISGQAWSQSPESDITPEAAEQGLDQASFAVPDVPDTTLEDFVVVDKHDRFNVKFGIVALVDYTSFDQDDSSYEQVGNQSDKLEARSLRLSARGFFELWRRWDYMASYEYKGFDQTSESDWNVTDLRVGTKLGPGTLTIGKIKQAHVYEMVGDAANLPHHERLLSPFFVSREVGVSYAGQMPDQVGTWTIGWHNNWLTESGEDWSDSGNDFAARVTWLPLWQEEGRNFVHLGASIRYVGNDEDTLRMKGRPASNVASNFVDTGNMESDHAWNYGLEALLNKGSWSLLAEYVRADVHSAPSGDPTFTGWYLTGSWVVTGDYRPYDRKAGYARRVLPQGEWGAVELVARVGRVDLDDAGVEGGTMDGWWLGANWWATRRWKASIGYGNIDLDRFGVDGNTETLLSRIQWIF